MEHLDEGWFYTMSIPVSEIRQRLACMWPILLAGETLKRVKTAPDLLDPAVNIKAPRSVVYRVMAITVADRLQRVRRESPTGITSEHRSPER